MLARGGWLPFPPGADTQHRCSCPPRRAAVRLLVAVWALIGCSAGWCGTFLVGACPAAAMNDPANSCPMGADGGTGATPTGPQCCSYLEFWAGSTDLSSSAFVATAPDQSTCVSVGGLGSGPVQVSSVGSGQFVCGISFDPASGSYSGDGFVFSSLTFGTGGSGGGGGGSAFDISQLDTVQAGEAFAAAFVIVGMCWALGKAVGAVLDVVRR
jgi:hypothetical protein